MQEQTGEYFEDKEMASNVKRYEVMKKTGMFTYFDVDEIIDVINFYIDNSLLNKAHEACKSGLSIHPTSSELKLKNAQLFMGRGQANDALLWLDKVRELSKWNHEYLLTKGMAMSLLNSTAEAEKYFSQALKIVSDNEKEDVILNIADSLDKSNAVETAIYYFELGSKINPKNEEFYFRLGLSYNNIGEFDKSINSYNKYLDINPFSENVWFNLGIVLNSAEKYKESIEAYDYAISLDATHYDALFNKANALANHEKYNEAIEVYNTYLRAFKNNPTAKYYIGECYIQLKDFEKALEHFDSILIDNKNFAEAFYGKAMVYEEMNKPDEAIKNYKKALVIDEDNTDAWFSIGNLYIKLKKFSNAVEAFDKALSINKFDIEAWLLNAEAYDKLEDISKSIDLLLEATEYLPDNSDIIYALSAYYFKSDNNNLGIEWFKKAYSLEKENYKLVLNIFPEAKTLIEKLLETK